MTFEEEFIHQAPSTDKSAVQECLVRLIDRYNEPHRFYHNLNHIESGLKTYHELFSEPLDPVLFFSWAYHDAVYDSKRSDNEKLSADIWWRDAHTLGFIMDQADSGVAFIRATDPSNPALSVINDIDLSGLGASPEVFNQNTDNIRKEYYWVEPEVWRKGRIAVLMQFLRRDSLYLTEPFAEKFTDQAIDNLKNAILKLSQS